MSQIVTFGPFRFCSKQQLDSIRNDFVTKAASFNSGLTGASVNGQSFQFEHAGVTYSREEFGDQLAAAYNSLGFYEFGTPTSNRAGARCI